VEAKSPRATLQDVARQELRIPAAPTLTADLAALFPAGAVVAELREPGDAVRLMNEEAAFVAEAVPSRRAEFAAGRQCARRALAEFGVVDFPLKVGGDGIPVWPDFLVGSITHTAGLCAAVVAERTRFTSLAVDSEVVADVGEPLWRKVCVAPEIEWLKSLPRAEQAAGAALIFSAKEAFHKCHYPITGEALTFQDVRVVASLSAATGDFVIAPLTPVACAALTAAPLRGKFRFHEQFVTTGLSWAAHANVQADARSTKVSPTFSASSSALNCELPERSGENRRRFSVSGAR